MASFFDFAVNGPMYTGIVVALITWFMMTKFKELNTTALVAVIGVLFAGAVVSFIQLGSNAADASAVVGRYSFGLLVGTVVYAVVHRLSRGTWPTSMNG